MDWKGEKTGERALKPDSGVDGIMLCILLIDFINN